MHDCQATRARLIDLIFGEAAGGDALRAEALSCADCAAEYRALAETLRSFDRAAEEARPAEEFWPRYHARLARRVAAAAHEASPNFADDERAGTSPPVAWLGRALAAKWSVPAPVAVAALLLILCLTPLALRSSSTNVAPSQQGNDPAPAAGEPPPVRTIEVPVVQEKIVTRTIYVGRAARRKARAARTGDVPLASGSSPALAQPTPPRDTLTGFQPAGDVKLRVIKGSYEDER